MKDYFTDKFIGVKGSSNYFLDLESNRSDLLNNFMYFSNKTLPYTLKLKDDKL